LCFVLRVYCQAITMYSTYSLRGHRVLLSRIMTLFYFIFKIVKLVESVRILLSVDGVFWLRLPPVRIWTPAAASAASDVCKTSANSFGRRRFRVQVAVPNQLASSRRIGRVAGGITAQIVEAVSPDSASVCVFVRRTSPSYKSAWETRGAVLVSAASLANGRRKLNIVSAAASRGDSSTSSTEWQLK